MATPRAVSRRLREMLGAEAAQSMVDWLDGLEEHHDSLRHEVRADMAELRQEFAVLRAEMRIGFAAVDVKLATLREEMRVGFAAVDAKIAERNATLMKWMIGFWIGSFVGIVGAILAASRMRP